MMKKILLATAALAVLSTAASAADLPRKTVAPVFAASPVASWTGFYAGVNAGYSWSAAKNGTAGPGFDPLGVMAIQFAFNVFPRNIPLQSKGFLGGAQIGYNYQFAGTGLVVGLETDLQYSAARAKSAFINTTLNSFYNGSTQMGYLGTLRGRFGFAATPDLLIYATGGLAYGNVKYSGNAGAPGQLVLFSESQTKFGFTVGAGAEYALTRNVSIKAEYLYYDLGKTSTHSTPFAGGAFTTIAYEQKNSGHILRSGLNYRF